MSKKKEYGPDIPQHEIDALAHCLLPEIQKYFDSEEGKKEFAEWKAKQEHSRNDKNDSNP